MSLFLLVFFFLYGSTHLYFFLKLKAVISLAPVGTLCLVFFLIVMTLAPVLIRLLENEGLEAAARLMAYTGYLWMGFLFLFTSASLVFDICRLLVLGAGILFHRGIPTLAAAHQPAFLISLCWGIAAATYGYFEARTIRTERVVLVSPKIPRSVGRLTIVQISDVHLGLMVRQERLARILARVKAAAPDVLVSTGDLVDGQINWMTNLIELFQDVKPRYGKYAVTGNHEAYAGLAHSIDFTERAGFKVLRNSGITVDDLITVVGIDDPAADRDDGSRTEAERSLLATFSSGTFTLFLKHRPVINRESLGLFDLQLSGHVHKGQIFPFNLVTHLFYPVRTGYSLFPQGSALYVNRGAGTWGPPIRFLAPPEVTVIELISPPEVR